MICDSNILIYAAEPGDTVCQPYVEKAEAMISSVTRIEVLGFPRFSALSPYQQVRLKTLVASTMEIVLEADIISQAILPRQQKAMKLGDAIIAATALVYHLPLVTRNEDDFSHIADLDLRNPFSTTAA